MTKIQNRGGLGFFGIPSLGGGGGEIKITGADTVASFLGIKIVAGTNISLMVLNPGGNEQLEISASASILEVLEAGVTSTIVSEDIFKNNSTNAITLNLPLLANFDKILTVFAGTVAAGGTITIDPNGAQMIDGASTKTVNAGQSFSIFPFSAEWNTI